MEDGSDPCKSIGGNHQSCNASIAPSNGRQAHRLTIRDIASMPLRIPPINQVGQDDNTRSILAPNINGVRVIRPQPIRPQQHNYRHPTISMLQDMHLDINDMAYEDDSLDEEVENLVNEHLLDVEFVSLSMELENVVDERQDMSLDMNEMSYEELVDWLETIGSENSGLSEETIVSRLKTKVYSPSPIALNLEELPSNNQEIYSCMICQEEFKNEDKIGIIQCVHEYHVECITQWLLLKNNCPVCRLEAMTL